MGEDRGKREKGSSESPAARARAALKDGNFALARALAQGVLNDENASQASLEEARSVLDATRIDRAPIVVGVVMFLVLAVLFGWVLTRAHG